MKNRFLIVLLMVCLIFTVAISVVSCASNEEDNNTKDDNQISTEFKDDRDVVNKEDATSNISYEDGTPYLIFDLKQDDTYEVVGYKGEPKSILIPSSYGQIPVTSIRDEALVYCTSLTHVKMQNSIKAIGRVAFAFCTNLLTVDISMGTTYIGEFAFAGCISLTDINVDENNNVYKTIDGSLYNKAGTILMQYTLGKYETFTVPEGVEIIQKLAFGFGVKLKKIHIANTVTTLMEDSFNEAVGLEKVTFGDDSNLLTIESCAFSECVNLTNITIPNSVKSLGANAFYRNVKLTGEVIGKDSQLENIGNSAFDGCTNLIWIYIPSSVKSIGYQAFNDCNNLPYTIKDNIKYLGTQDNEYLIAISMVDKSASTVILVDGCKFIYGNAFNGATNLTDILIWKSVVNIGEFAIYGCSNLQSIYYEGSAEEWDNILKPIKWNAGMTNVEIEMDYNGFSE